MEYVVIAFRSRSHTVKFSKMLTENNIYNEIVNTPKEAGVGCGLSVKVSKKTFSIVKRAVNIGTVSSFAGYFIVKNINGKRIVKPI